MNIIKKLKWRYAVKKFDASKIVAPKKIKILLKAFNLTATSYGLQPLKLVVVENKKIQETLFKHAYFQQQIKDASHVLVICIQTQFTNKDIDAYFDLEKVTRGTSEEILEKYRKQLKENFDNKSALEIQQFATNQAYIALGNLMTVCAVENIDACPMEGFDTFKFDDILGLQKHHLHSVLALPVGYRHEDDFMSKLKKVRKPFQEMTLNIS